MSRYFFSASTPDYYNDKVRKSQSRHLSIGIVVRGLELRLLIFSRKQRFPDKTKTAQFSDSIRFSDIFLPDTEISSLENQKALSPFHHKKYF